MRSPAGGEIGEAPPVADEASRFRGSAPIGGHDSARQSVGTTVGKRAPPLRKRNKNYGEAGRRGRRPLQSSIGEWCVGADVGIGSPHRTSCYANASGGVLSVTSDRKYPKNAAKTNGFGFLARAWYGKYRGPSAPRMKQYKSVPCFRIVSDSIHRDALRACAARPNRTALRVYRAARCGHRALRSSIGKRSVGDDAYIVPPLPAIKLSVGADASIRPNRPCPAPPVKNHVIARPVRKLVVAIRTPVPTAPLPKGGCRPGDSTGRRTSWAVASFLSYLSYPIFQKKQGFPCEFFVIRATSAFFLLPNAPTCSKITLLTVLRVKLRSRSCAMDAHESCQAGNRAALRGIIHVPQGRRLCGFMGRTIYFRKNSKGIFTKRFAARRAHNFCAKRKNSTPAG